MPFTDIVSDFIRLWRKGRCILICPVCTARKSSRSKYWLDWMDRHERRCVSGWKTTCS